MSGYVCVSCRWSCRVVCSHGGGWWGGGQVAIKVMRRRDKPNRVADPEKELRRGKAEIGTPPPLALFLCTSGLTRR
jgi:hypothetical protein